MQGFDDTMEGGLMALKLEGKCGIFRSEYPQSMDRTAQDSVELLLLVGNFPGFLLMMERLSLSSESGTSSFVK